MTVDLLRRAVAAMTAQAGHMEAEAAAATPAPWCFSANSGSRQPGWLHNDKSGLAFDSIATEMHPSDALLTADLRNSVARYIATLRATARLLDEAAGWLQEMGEDALPDDGTDPIFDVARAILGEAS